MELKRKQEEEDRKKRDEEEKVIQVWTTLKYDIFLYYVYSPAKKLVKPGADR